MRRTVLVAMLVVTAVAGAPASSPQQAETTLLLPDDFARGVEITAPSGAFFRIDLPEFVFAGTAWPDLRDLRVFNRAGESVPFARITPPRADAGVKRVQLRPFRIESQTPGSAPQIVLDPRARVLELRVAPGVAPQTGVEYVLAVADPDLATPIHRLFLDWEERATNWRQAVTVSVSSDLESWSVVASHRLLMDLKTADGARLRQGEIAVEPRTPNSARYWRLQFGPGEPPTLTGVEGETRSAEPDLLGVPVRTSGPIAQDGAAVYQLAAPQPVSRLRIMPQDVNSVLPLLVEVRDSQSNNWSPLLRTVAYRMNSAGGEQLSDPIHVQGGLISAIRLQPLGTSWGSGMPLLEVEREPVTLVVNARGAGPFLLAWGSRAASDSAVPFSELVPNWSSDCFFEIPASQPGAMRELGGDARLTALGPAERAARWQTVLVWLVLIGGAGALALLAFRVWREARVTGDQA